MKYTTLILTFILALTQFAQGQMQRSFEKTSPIPEKFTLLPLSEIEPEGWIKAQIVQNLKGFTGHLDSLVPDLILKDDIYGKDRLSKKVKNKDVGAISEEGEAQAQFLWWNSETQSNWWDGLMRSAILVNDPVQLARVENYIKNILKTQDPDGYIGIYTPELRYKFDNENGELWAKTTLLRSLLGWYEFKKQKKVLAAVERAVQDVMKHYPTGASNPFKSKAPNSYGVTHGLVFTDVLESLYRLTGNTQYRDYCIFLYQDYSAQTPGEDAPYKKLIDSTLVFSGHGVHTYEHLRAVAAAYYASGNPSLKNALRIFLQKINQCTTPSGGPAGDEFIGGRTADATTTGYEYCSIHELMLGYADLLTKTGECQYGDKAENLFFNAAQGARHPEKSCIAYLKTDNSYEMIGNTQNGKPQPKQTRYQYSPTHQEAAACCVSNAGRIATYFVQRMWMKQADTLVATLLGPCTVRTSLKGQDVTIREITNYPNDQEFVFEIELKKAAHFTLKIRKPEWATGIETTEQYRLEHEYIVLEKDWQKQDRFSLKFTTAVTVHKDLAKGRYFTYGPLVYANKITAVETVTKQHPLPGFTDLQYRPAGELRLHTYVPFNEARFDKGMIFVKLRNPKSGALETITLVPLGQTILRQTTF
ncbi:MAG: beta-L-arabinofuranosidase domain-containing protein [Bacteroidota bacterium]